MMLEILQLEKGIKDEWRNKKTYECKDSHIKVEKIQCNEKI